MARRTVTQLTARRLGRRARYEARARYRRASARVAGARYKIDPTLGAVALTFDDGPDAHFTPLVLDVLAAVGVHATFFVVGDQAARFPQLVKRILAEGHALGTHSATHPWPMDLELRQVVRDYRAGREMVEDIAGRSIRLFRPPHGQINLYGAAAIRTNCLEAWLWTIDPQDWSSTSVDDLLAATSSLSPGDVVLLHDGIRQPITTEAEDRSTTVAGLPEIVEEARSRGVRFVTLPLR